MAFKCQRWTLANILPIMFVMWIITTIWVLHFALHLLHLIRHEDADLNAQGVKEAIISQSLTVMMMISFCRAVFTDPGSVPDSPEWSSRAQQVAKMRYLKAQELTDEKPKSHELKQTGERRFCKWCDQFKPDRCHHCRVCRSCILRMDHHCPWIANCVGFRNHKFFFLHVLYSLLNCLYIVTTMWMSVLRAANDEMAASTRLSIVFGITLAIKMSALLGIFFIIHIVLIVRAMTTIEYCEKQSKKVGNQVSYDAGVYGNITAALGPSVLLWLLPLFPPGGLGTQFDTTAGQQESSINANCDALLPPGQGASVADDKDNAEKLKARIERDTSPPEVTGRRASEA